MFGFYCTNNLCTIHVHNHTTTKSYTCMHLSHTHSFQNNSLTHTHTQAHAWHMCVCEYSTQLKNILKKTNLSSLSVCHSVHVLDSSSCKGHHGSYTLFPLAQCLHSGLSWSHLLAAMKHRGKQAGQRERESPVCWQF